MLLVKEFFVSDDDSGIYLDEELFEKYRDSFYFLIFPESACPFKITGFNSTLKEIFSDRKWDKQKLETFFFHEAINVLWTQQFLKE
jgi:hypothetical protein